MSEEQNTSITQSYQSQDIQTNEYQYNLQISDRHIDNLNLRLKDLPIYNKLKQSTNQELKQIISVKRNPILYSKPGYILRVDIKGFLTHINKSIDITNVIQLLFGPNGSGKSSILESIVFCLCGEKNHIRQNLEHLSNLKTQAGLLNSVNDENEVAVIKQTSVTVYFAQPLAIRRTITEKDTSIYQICDFQNDKTKFKKISKQNVIDILHQLNHYPNNRVTMVNQQEMKQLARMQPSERYNLFSDASGLTNVMIKMKSALEDIEKIKDTIYQCQQLRNKLKEQYKEIDQKWKDAEILRKQQEILLKLQLKQEACQFGQKYMVLYNTNEKKQLLIQQFTKINQRCNDIQQKYENASKNSDQTKNDIQYKKDQRVKIYDEQNQLQTIASKIQKELQQQKSNIDFIQDNILQKQKQIQNSNINYLKYQNTIQQYKQQEPLYCPQESEELILLKEECIELNNQKNEITQRIYQLQRQEQDIKQQYTNIQSGIEIQNNKIEELNQDLKITNQNISNVQQNLNLQHSMIKNLQAYNRQFQDHDFTNLKYGILPYLHVYVKKQYQQYGQLIKSMIQPETLQQLVYLKENEKQFNNERNKIDQYHIISDVKYYKVIQQRDLRQEIQKHEELRNIKIIIVTDCLQFTHQLALQHLIIKSSIDQICITDTRDHAYLIAGLLNRVYVYCEEFKSYLYNNNGQIDSNKNRVYQKGAQIYIDDDITIENYKKKVQQIQFDINQANILLQQYQQKLEDLNYNQQLNLINKQKEQQTLLEKQKDNQLQEKQNLRNKQQQQFNEQMKLYNEENNKRDTYKNEYDHALIKAERINNEIMTYQQEVLVQQEKLNKYNIIVSQIEQNYQNVVKKIENYKNQAAQLSQEIKQLTELLDQISQDKIQKTLIEIQSQLQNLQEKIQQQDKIIKQTQEELLQFSQQLSIKLNKIQSQQFIKVSQLIKDIQQNDQYINNYAQIIAQFVYISDQQNVYQQTQQIDEQINIKPSQDLFDNCYLKYSQGIKEAEISCQELQQQFTYNINEIQSQRISIFNKLNDNSKNIQFAKNTLQSTTQILGKLIVKIAALRETCRQKICQEFDKQVSLLNLQMALQFNLKPIPKLEDFHLDSNVLQGQDKELYQQLTQANISDNIQQDEINIILKDRDVSTLSGGEQTFTALAFIMSCIQITKSIFFSCDEWDVYLDAERRTNAFEKLVKMISMSDVQTILVTPNDVDLDSVQLKPEEKQLISVEKLKGVKRL